MLVSENFSKSTSFSSSTSYENEVNQFLNMQTKKANSKISTADNKLVFVSHMWVLGWNYTSYTRIYGMSLAFMSFCAAKPYLHMVLKTPRGSRAVSRVPRCSGNTNHSGWSLPKLPRWNRLIARLSWEQLTGAEGWLVSTPRQSLCCWIVPRKTPTHPLRLALALLLSCVSALKTNVNGTWLPCKRLYH